MDEKEVREAIEALKIINLKRVHPFYDWEEMREIRDIAIKALEKQLPKKTRENGMQDGLIRKNKYYTCPTCGNCLLTEMMNERQNTSYCWDCGQKLDWSE